MQQIINFVINIILCFIAFLCLKKSYKKMESIFEKDLFLTLMFVFIAPWTIYILDKYDIPTKLGILNNLNSDRTFEFACTLLCTIIGALISGIILIYITNKQIDLQIIDSNENKRIQNAPILKYEVTNKYKNNCIQKNMNNNGNNLNSYSLFLNIENVGLNHARHLHFEVQLDNKKKKIEVDKVQSLLMKNSNIWFDLVFEYKHNDNSDNENTKIIKIFIYYEDLLNNEYKQEIELHLYVTKIFSLIYGGYKFEIKKTIIKDEVLID